MDKTEGELELETLEGETRLVEAELKVELDPKQLASRKRAHEAKVAKFLAGGEF